MRAKPALIAEIRIVPKVDQGDPVLELTEVRIRNGVSIIDRILENLDLRRHLIGLLKAEGLLRPEPASNRIRIALKSQGLAVQKVVCLKGKISIDATFA